MARKPPLRTAFPRMASVIERLWPLLRRFRGLIALSSIALATEVGLRVLEPWPLKVVFDRLLPSAVKGSEHGADLWLTFVGAGVAFVAIIALAALASYWGTVGFALVGSRLVTVLREQLYRHMQRLSMSFHTTSRSGDLVLRVTSDISMLRDVAITALLPLVVSALVLVGMVAVMFWMNWALTLAALATFPLFWITAWRSGKRILVSSREQRARLASLASHASETLGAIQVVQSLTLEDDFGKAFASQSRRSLKEGVKTRRLMAALERRVELITAVSRALVLGFGAHLVVRGDLTPGDLVVYWAYLGRTFRPLRYFAKHTGRIAKAAAAGERVLDILEQEPDVQDAPDAVPAPPLRGALTFDDVHFAYEVGRDVLAGASFEALPGQRLALVGSSGAGKSTLASLALRFYDPTAGRVLVDGVDVRRYTLRSLRSQVSVVLQDSILFACSLRENIEHGRPGCSLREIEAAARLADIHDFIAGLPDGYETVVGERGVTLSHGQRQRIAIARAAVRRAPILILDEPTASLDRESQHAVMEALERLARQHTTLFITHDLWWAERADLILVLDGGTIAERGSHTELMSRGGSYATLVKQRTLVAASGPASL